MATSLSQPEVEVSSPAPAEAPATPPPPTADRSSALHSSIDWSLRQASPVRRALNALEGLSLAIEKPIVRLVREPQWNPLYHTGTITVFALLIILVTGVYLTMFFPFGFDDSYQAVARIENNLVGRLMRAMHRYASALALLAALLHGWRTFFMDRFRGPRWLAWGTGILMTVLIWGAGLTGYWLIFDTRAQLLNQALINTLGGFAAGVRFLNRFLLTEAAGQGWLFILGVLTVHLGLSAVIGLFYYFHIKRLRRAKLLPPRYWMAVLGGLLLIGALLVPVGMLGPADFGQLPTEVPIDLFFLFYLPAALQWPPALFWGGVIVLVAVLTLIPWLLVRKPLQPIQIHKDRCTGCTLCAADCPYRAITMVERTDGSPHKLLAVVDPKRCVSCGICIGSCPPLAITLGNRPIEPLWQETVARASTAGPQPLRVVFTCERHAAHGARDYLTPPERSAFHAPNGQHLSTVPRGPQPAATAEDVRVQVIPLTCIGMAHPDLAVRALAAGAAEVQFVGCPPEDCANREGNVWMQDRLGRTRLPRLRRNYATAPIARAWTAPNDFGMALQGSHPPTNATTYRFKLTRNNWHTMLPALALLGVVLALTIALTGVTYRPLLAKEATLRIDLRHRSGFPVVTAEEEDLVLTSAPDLSTAAPSRLIVLANGKTLLDKTYPLRDPNSGPVQALEQVPLPAGQQQVQVLLYDRVDQTQPTEIMNQVLSLGAGQILPLVVKDARLGADPVAGKRLFSGNTLGTNTGCVVCHSLDPNGRLVGPSLAGVATRAAERVPGLSAEEYLRQSILEPNAYVVEGYPANLMPPNFAQTLSDRQVDDLVGFLMTLR